MCVFSPHFVVMPPLRHLAFFKFVLSATPVQVQAVVDELRMLRAAIPGILYYELFRASPVFAQSSHGQGYSLMIDSIFHDLAALSVYESHPAHQAVIAQHIAPVLADSVVVDYELPVAFNLEAFKQHQQPPHVRHFALYGLNEAGHEAAMRAQWEALVGKVPAVLSVLVGQQDSAGMYSGYTDRSKGMANVVELLLRDEAARDEYHQSPQHQQIMHDHCAHIDSLQMFDYQL